MTTDERNGKPSASGIERLSFCPGSWQLERTLPPLPETEDAASGTRIHASLAGLDVLLKDDELEVADRCRDGRITALEQIFGTAYVHVELERRLWFRGRFSGKADVFAWEKKMDPEIGCVLDYKAGRNEVTTAEGNLQLRALAVLLQANHEPFDRIVVGIIQPWADEPISLCEYTHKDLARAKEWLLGVLDAAKKPDAPRVPGEKQCRYCRAKAVCPEAQAAALMPFKEENWGVALSPKEMAQEMTSYALRDCLNKASFAELIINAVKDEAKRRLQAGEEVPGWRLKEGATKEVITDLEKVQERFIGYGGTTQQYFSCLSATKGKLESSLKEVTGYKGRELKEAFSALVDGCVETKQNAPSLERIK